MKGEIREQYVYIYLDNRKPGKWYYKDLEFDYQPFYVGRGKGRRINEHLCPSKRLDFSIKTRIINKIIETCHEKPIYRKIYENLSLEEADSIETEIVHFFGRLDLGTGILANGTDGGKGKRATRFVTPREKKKKGAPVFTPQSKRVDQYDMNNNFIQKFDSAALASRSLTNNSLEAQRIASAISSCCHGKSKATKGFIWKFDGTSPYDPKPRNSYFLKEIYQYSLEGVFLQKFESHKQALISIGRGPNNSSSLSNCISGKYLKAYGFRWKSSFEGENIGPLPPKRR